MTDDTDEDNQNPSNNDDGIDTRKETLGKAYVGDTPDEDPRYDEVTTYTGTIETVDDETTREQREPENDNDE